MLTVMKDVPIMSVDLGIIANGCCHTMDINQALSTIKVYASLWRTLSRSRLSQYGPQKYMPLIGGLCHTADFDQSGLRMCHLLEDFVTQRILTKCGQKMCPSLEDFVAQRTWTKCGLKVCSSLEDFVT
jgi:hypothetical protein